MNPTPRLKIAEQPITPADPAFQINRRQGARHKIGLSFLAIDHPGILTDAEFAELGKLENEVQRLGAILTHNSPGPIAQRHSKLVGDLLSVAKLESAGLENLRATLEVEKETGLARAAVARSHIDSIVEDKVKPFVLTIFKRILPLVELERDRVYSELDALRLKFRLPPETTEIEIALRDAVARVESFITGGLAHVGGVVTPSALFQSIGIELRLDGKTDDAPTAPVAPAALDPMVPGALPNAFEAAEVRADEIPGRRRQTA